MMKYSLILLTLACSGENKIYSVDDGNGGNGSAIEVTPLSLNFGEVSASEESASVQSFMIRSIGGNDLTVTGIDIMGDDGASFTFVEDLGEFTLAPDEEQQVDILFAPMGANQQMAQAVVHSTDGSQPHIPVNLIGVGLISELEISPDPLNFGETVVGCELGNTITLTNIGTESLDVTNINYAETTFSVVSTPNMPFTLAPGDSETVETR